MTYMEKLHNKFGFPPPDMSLEAWLAGMENVQMRKAMGLQFNGRMHAIGSGVITEAMRAKLRAAALEQHKKRMEELLRVMRRPMTVETLMDKTGWSKSTVRRALNRALNEGRACIAQTKAPQVWQRKRMEAAQ